MRPRRPALGHTPCRRAIAGKWGPDHARPRSGPTAAGKLSRLMPVTMASITTGGAAQVPIGASSWKARALDHRAHHEHLLARHPELGEGRCRSDERDPIGLVTYRPTPRLLTVAQPATREHSDCRDGQQSDVHRHHIAQEILPSPPRDDAQNEVPRGRDAAITQARRSVKRAPAATPALKTTRNGAQSTTLIAEPSLRTARPGPTHGGSPMACLNYGADALRTPCQPKPPDVVRATSPRTQRDPDERGAIGFRHD
ncbi:hypothetical protein BH23CHL10_BH23CHL10_05680 [soil metagenome]